MSDRRSPLDVDDEPGAPKRSLYEELGIASGAPPVVGARPAEAPKSPRSFDDLIAAPAAPEPSRPLRPAPPPDGTIPGVIRVDGVPELPPGLPDPLSLDVESGREQLFMGLVILCLAAAFICFYLGTGHRGRYDRRYYPPSWPHGVYYIPIPLAGAALFGLLRAGTRDEHRLHLRRRTLNYRTSFFGHGEERVIYRAGEVERIFLKEHLKKNKHSSWMEYSIVAVDQRGESYTVAKSERDLSIVSERARAVAAALGAKFQAGII